MSGAPRRLGLSYETTAVNAIDLAAARRLQAGFMMSIALGSSVKSGGGTGVGPGVLAVFDAFAGFFAFGCASWALTLVAATQTVSANDNIQNKNLHRIITPPFTESCRIRTIC